MHQFLITWILLLLVSSAYAQEKIKKELNLNQDLRMVIENSTFHYIELF